MRQPPNVAGSRSPSCIVPHIQLGELMGTAAQAETQTVSHRQAQCQGLTTWEISTGRCSLSAAGTGVICIRGWPQIDSLWLSLSPCDIFCPLSLFVARHIILGLCGLIERQLGVFPTSATLWPLVINECLSFFEYFSLSSLGKQCHSKLL